MAVSNKSAQLQQIKIDLFKNQNLETGQFDVAFEVEGNILYAHKTMLNLVSPTFSSMLSDRWTKKNEPIKIDGYGYDDFYQFITFLYSGQCQLTDTTICTMVDIAEFYGINLFKEYCDEYLAAMTITTENIFKLMDLAEKYSMGQLKTSTYEYVFKNFQAFVNCDGFSKVSKSFIEELVFAAKDKAKPEDLFLAVYKWSEQQALIKHTVDSNLNLIQLIRTEFSDFLPQISFDKMEWHFLFESVVKITNTNGQTLHGNLIPDTTVIENIKSLNLSTGLFDQGNSFWWDPKFEIPSASSPLKKREGVEWYLFYFSSGRVAVKHCSTIAEHYYVLAELTAGISGFEPTYNCKIEID